MSAYGGAARSERSAAERPVDERAPSPSGEARELLGGPSEGRSGSDSRADVAMLEPVSGHGGIEYYGFGLAEALGRLGTRVVLHTCDETAPPAAASFDFAASYRGIFGTDPAWQRGARYLAGTVRALGSARRQGASVCHLHLFHAGPLQLFDALVARALGFKVVATVHDVSALSDRRPWPDLARRTFAAADRLIAHNPSTRDEIRRILPASPPIDVIPAGTPEWTLRDLPSRESARDDLAIPQEAELVLSFGHVKQSKGIELLLRALASLRERRPRAMLLLAGRAAPEAVTALRDQIRALGLDGRCRIIADFVPHARVPFLFAAADLAVLPYRRSYQSSVLLLAMACGLPAVASDLPGMRDTITDGESGFLFTAGDEGALATAIERALADRVRTAEIARAARGLVTTRHAWPAIAEQTLDSYRTASPSRERRRSA
jgi:D-inositol-3-phosphate glycosyltransferase